jgi:hypothetical protein
MFRIVQESEPPSATREQCIRDATQIIKDNIPYGVGLAHPDGRVAILATVKSTDNPVNLKFICWIDIASADKVAPSLQSQNRGIDKIAEIIVDQGWKFRFVDFAFRES